MSKHSSTSVGELLVYGVFGFLSVFVAAIVVTFFMVATAPLVAAYPADSGLQEIVFAVSMLWGVVVGCLVAVLTIGPWHRHRVRGSAMMFDDIDDDRLNIPMPRHAYYKPAGTEPKSVRTPRRVSAYAE